MIKNRIEWITGKDTSIHESCVHLHTHTHAHIHTHTHTGPSSDLHWDSRDQRRVATAVSQRVRLPCHHHPQGLHQGNDPTSNQHTQARCPPTAPCPPAGTRLNRSPETDTAPGAHECYTSYKWAQQLVAVKLKPAHRKWENVQQQYFHSAIKKTVKTLNSDMRGWVSNSPKCFHIEDCQKLELICRLYLSFLSQSFWFISYFSNFRLHLLHFRSTENYCWLF